MPTLGFIKVLLGRAEEAEADLTNAMRLSPRDPGLDRWYALLGIADLFLGRLDRPDRLVNRLNKCERRRASVFPGSGLALSGRAAEAREAREGRPPARPELYRREISQRAANQNPTFLAQRKRIYEG